MPTTGNRLLIPTHLQQQGLHCVVVALEWAASQCLPQETVCSFQLICSNEACTVLLLLLIGLHHNAYHRKPSAHSNSFAATRPALSVVAALVWTASQCLPWDLSAHSDLSALSVAAVALIWAAASVRCRVSATLSFPVCLLHQDSVFVCSCGVCSIITLTDVLRVVSGCSLPKVRESNGCGTACGPGKEVDM
eukprot:1161310-Pelagomonas_calceolata.AAC.6